MKRIWQKFFIILTAVSFVPVCADAASRYYWKRRCLEYMNANPAEIEISYNFGQLQYNNTLSSKDIQKKVTPNDSVQAGTKYMGLTLMNHYNKVYVMSSVPQELGDGYYCTYPIRVQVITGYAEPTVYLANSMKKNSCLYRKTLRHEYQHVDNAHIYLNLYIQALEKKIPKMIKDIGPLLSTEENPEQNLFSLYKKQIDTVYEHYFNEYREKNQKMDTLQNYEKESLLCH